MKVILLIVGIVLFWTVVKRVEIRWKKQKIEVQKEKDKKEMKFRMLKELRTMKKYDENGYAKETHDAIQQLNNEIDVLIESVIKEEIIEGHYEQVAVLKEKEQEIELKMKASHQDIEQTIQSLHEKVTYIKEYLESTNFYPPQFALDNNKLNGMIVEIKDRKKENPFIDLTKYNTFAEVFYDEVKTFQEQHEIVSKLVEKTNEKIKHVSKEKATAILELKNAMSIHLHKGEIDKVKKTVKELKKML